MGVRSHRIDKIDKITRGVRGIILGVGSHRIDKITWGEGADLGEVMGHPELTKLTKLQWCEGNYFGSQITQN